MNEWQSAAERGRDGSWEHLKEVPETVHGEGSQEAMGVTSEEIHSSGDMEPEVATPCSQIGGPSVER